MIKIVIKYLLYIHFFLLVLLISFPKTNLYHWGLEQLQKEKIALHSSAIDDNFFSFETKNLEGYYENIPIAQVEKTTLSSYFYTTSVVLEDIQLNDIVKGFSPEFIKKVEIKHSLFWNPLSVYFEGFFPKGRLFGEVDLLEKRVTIFLEVPKDFLRKYTKSLQKFTKEGEYYRYELHY